MFVFIFYCALPIASLYLFRESKFQCLGIFSDQKLNFVHYLDYIKKKADKLMEFIDKIFATTEIQINVCKLSYVGPHFDNLETIWCKAGKIKLKELDSDTVQKCGKN